MGKGAALLCSDDLVVATGLRREVWAAVATEGVNHLFCNAVGLGGAVSVTTTRIEHLAQRRCADAKLACYPCPNGLWALRTLQK